MTLRPTPAADPAEGHARIPMAEEVLISLDPPEPEAIHLGGKGMQLNAHARQSPITRQKTHPIRDALDDTGIMASGKREQKRI